MPDRSPAVDSFVAKMLDAHTRQHGEPDEVQREYLHALAADLVEQLQVPTFYASASRYGHPSSFTANRANAVEDALFPDSWVVRRFQTGPERDE
ncbi:hypothetical protein [Nesterenkonia jeotgali]|uniref:Uncharacterized protein n=1 Tax=Nesterenkonia jeotgali TaxID=317018 RepID=A0A839FFJ6_9MICC|nr:hypothetical protein [Nesterenkonia jeotgali]MBA8920458.1 hypothetical protein [Nesterenkonia jeotgali]